MTIANGILGLKIDDTNSIVGSGPGMVIGNCTTISNPQWGECQAYFASISVSGDASVKRRIMIPSLKAAEHFLFLTNSFVV